MFLLSSLFGKLLYPLPCLVVIKRQSGMELFFDRAKRVVDKSTQKEWFRLQKMGPCKSTTFRNTIRSNKGLYSMMYSPGRAEFSPLSLKDEVEVEIENEETGEKKMVGVPIVTPMSEDQRDFIASMYERAYTRFSHKQSLLERMLPILAPVILAFALVLVFWGYSNYGADAIAQTVSSVTTAIQNAAAVAAKTAAQVPVG